MPLDMADLKSAFAAELERRRFADGAGTFDGGQGPGHAVHMVIGAPNLFGEPVPASVGPYAPAADFDQSR